MTEEARASDAEREKLVRNFIVRSPLGILLGFESESVERDRVCVRLPYREEVTTLGDLMHGGALAALVDTAATAAAWSGLDDPSGARGTTVGFSLNYLSGLRARDALADARVARRGRSLVTVEVDVREEDGESCARALVTYKLDTAGPVRRAGAGRSGAS